MKRKSQSHHDPEKIKAALAQLKSGQGLSDVAKSFGVSKSLVSYWRDHNSDTGVGPARPTALHKSDERTRRFIEKCWTSIGLAFKRLDAELKTEKPHGVRDLALCLAVLVDKLNQAAQQLNSQAAPAQTGWAISENTLLLLRTHREARVSGPPADFSVTPGLEPSDLKLQKDKPLDAPDGTAEPAVGSASSPHVRDGRP